MGFKSVLFALATSLSFSVFAIPQIELPQRFMTELVPYMQSRYQKNFFSGVNQVPINYYFHKQANPDGVIVFSPGQSESSLKYAELLYDLRDLNYDVYIIDHRGQGESGRLLPDPIKSHVDKFSHYVDDLSYLINEIVKPQGYRRSFLMAHSMGGAIASGYLARHPKTMTAAILSSPMIEINTGYINNWGAGFFAGALGKVGLSTEYAPTQKPYDPQSSFKDNTVTSSPERYQIRKDLYNQHTELRIGGTTVNWLKESIEYTTKLRETKDVYQIPTVILQAGRDQFVWLRGQNKICGKSPAKCRIINVGFEKSQHEILMEVDEIRDKALSAIRAYIHYFETH
ncbi:alpha/beta fold hydrolase [bacterium]|nr:alpha/beta fold hydrolase [bacterium]